MNRLFPIAMNGQRRRASLHQYFSNVFFEKFTKNEVGEGKLWKKRENGGIIELLFKRFQRDKMVEGERNLKGRRRRTKQNLDFLTSNLLIGCQKKGKEPLLVFD